MCDKPSHFMQTSGLLKALMQNFPTVGTHIPHHEQPRPESKMIIPFWNTSKCLKMSTFYCLIQKLCMDDTMLQCSNSDKIRPRLVCVCYTKWITEGHNCKDAKITKLAHANRLVKANHKKTSCVYRIHVAPSMNKWPYMQNT